jgi:hypothetical protein
LILAEWLIEHGIGEDRALLIDGDKVLAAMLHWPGEVFAGQRLRIRLASRVKGSNRALAITESGVEVLLDRVPDSVSEGSDVDIILTRAPMAERGRLKRAQGRIAIGHENTASSPFDELGNTHVVRSLPHSLWEDVWHAASQGNVSFAGGSLTFSTTPAMTLIDVDGEGSPKDLALAAIPALAQGIRQFDLGGSIGVDFPTISDKAGRRAIDRALDEALADFPHERTAMNGFGFVQLVARLEGPSLLHRAAHSRTEAAARFVLRQAERVEGAGALLLTIHPAIKTRLKDKWLEELARRTGREVRIATDPTLALEGGFAQIVPL